MFSKISKILFKRWEKYFLFVFFAVFLSLFSYILANNIVLSIEDYLKSEIKPLVWWDVVISSRNNIDDKNTLNKYSKDFFIAKTISINSTIFDKEKNPSLIQLVYHSENYPFYNQFEFDTINPNWKIVVDEKTYLKYGKEIEILWKKYAVKWIIKKTPLKELSIYASQNTIYIPIDEFDSNLNSSNSRIEYDYYFKFRKDFDKKLLEKIKWDPDLKDFRIRSIEDRNESIWEITDRFYSYINFFNLIVFVLAFFIVIISLETFYKKIKTTLWLLNIFWLKKKQIFIYLFIIAFLVFFLSFIFAYISNIGLLKIFSLKYEFFEAKVDSLFRWFGIMLILLMVGIFSPIYKIYKSDISSLLKDESNFSNFTIKDYIFYLWLIFAGFLWVNMISWIDILKSLIYSLSFIFIIIIFYILINKLLNYIFEKFKKKMKDFYFFDAIRSTIKPWNVSFLIIFSSLVSFISIFVFFVFSASFLNYLNNLTSNSSDTFIINVQTKDKVEIDKYFSQNEIFEIVNLRISEINGKTLEQFLNTKNVSRQFSREFFSTTNILDNKILSWKNLKVWWVSVDKEFGDSLWIKIWDKIKFSVAWLEKELKVINFRESLRNWANPFFYFNLDKNDFTSYPKNYIISYREDLKEKNLENILYEKVWKHLTFIKTKEILNIVIDVASKILIVAYICLFYIFIFSFLSFLVSINFLKTFKISKVFLLNILWWNLKKLKNWVLLEFNYLLFLGLTISIFFWTIFLYIIFYFIPYFSLDLEIYFYWIVIISLILVFMNLWLIRFDINKKKYL